MKHENYAFHIKINCLKQPHCIYPKLTNIAGNLAHFPETANQGGGLQFEYKPPTNIQQNGDQRKNFQFKSETNKNFAIDINNQQIVLEGSKGLFSVLPSRNYNK